MTEAEFFKAKTTKIMDIFEKIVVIRGKSNIKGLSKIYVCYNVLLY